MTTLNINNIDTTTTDADTADKGVFNKAPKAPKARKAKAKAPVSETVEEAPKAKKSKAASPRKSRKVAAPEESSVIPEVQEAQVAEVPDQAPQAVPVVKTAAEQWSEWEASKASKVPEPKAEPKPEMSTRERVQAWLAKHNAETPIPVPVKVHQANLLDWQIIDRKARKVGSDDMQSAANVLKYGKEGGLHVPQDLEDAADIAQGITVALSLSLSGDYEGASQKSFFCLHAAKANPKVGSLKVDCRDGKERRVIDVLAWFAYNRQKVAADVAAAKEEQEILDAELADAEAAELADAEASANPRAAGQAKVQAILGSKSRAA